MKHYNVVAAVIYYNDKILCVQRGNHKYAYIANKYEFPGGKIEPGESKEAAIFREIKEELDIELISKSLRFINKFKAQAHGQSEGIILQMTCYSADFIGGINPSSEIEEVTWLTYKDKEWATPMIKIILDWFKERDLID